MYKLTLESPGKRKVKYLLNPKKIELTVGLPMYKSRNIVWLALQGLKNQKQVDFGWELIIFEEYGYSFDIIKKYIGEFPNCQKIYYLKMNGHIPLSTKWIEISKYASNSSNIFVMQDADDYSPSKRLYIHKELFKNKDCILSTFTRGMFFNIKTGQMMIYNNKNNIRSIKIWKI